MTATDRAARATLNDQLRQLAATDDPAVRPDHAHTVSDRPAVIVYGDEGRFTADGFRSEPVAVEPADGGLWRVTSLVVGTGQVGLGDLVRLGPVPAAHAHRDALVGEVVEVVERAAVARGRIATSDTAWVIAQLETLGDGVAHQAFGAAGAVVVQCAPSQRPAVDRIAAAATAAGRIVRTRWHD